MLFYLYLPSRKLISQYKQFMRTHVKGSNYRSVCQRLSGKYIKYIMLQNIRDFFKDEDFYPKKKKKDPQRTSQILKLKYVEYREKVMTFLRYIKFQRDLRG